MGKGRKVTIDRDGCVSCSLCWTSCPELFEQSPDDGHSQIVERYRINEDPAAGVVPDELLAAAQEAADGCPAEVICIH